MKLISHFGIETDDAKLIVDTVINGGVSLLLGAGASYGAVGGDRKELKGGADLAAELNVLFNLGLIEPDSVNLPLVYGDIAGQPSLVPRLNAFLMNRFSKCRPSWQAQLFKVNWKRIWTLNIDDVVERARPSSVSRTLSQYLWCEAFRPRTLGGNDLQMIYLHGKASELSRKTDHLIFSMKEYAARPETTPGWHAEFRADFVKKPFIVCGARLQEEFDLITVLEFGNRSRERGGCPSVVVLTEFAPGQAERFRRQGLIPVQASGEEFFKVLNDDVDEWSRTNPVVTEAFVVAKAEIRAKFKQLKISSLNPRKVLDFYASAETQWAHIIDNLDAHFFAVRTSVKWLTESDDIPAKVSLISGGAISGKTATALRIAAELIDQGYEVWQFRAEERFNEDDLLEFIRSNNKTGFVFDDCADFSNSLRSVIEKATLLRHRVRIVATCETGRLKAVRADLYQGNLKEFSLDPLHKNDFSALFTKRKQKGRLGRCSNFTEVNAWKEFRDQYNSRLLEWLESLENANPYRDAIVSILSDSSSQGADARNLICATATVHRFGYSLPFHVADDYISHKSLEVLVAEGGPLDQLGYLDEKGLRLRSSAFSQFVWDKMSPGDRSSWSLEIANKLAPIVVPQSISRRSLAYLIVRSIMDWETVKRDMRDKAEAWYSALEAAYGWNARFWEQRALLASDLNQEPMAYSYAKKAVTLHGGDPFPHTTLGKICIKIGLARKDAVGVERFWEGVRELEVSRQLALESRLEWEHPYTTFFTYALRANGLEHFAEEKINLSQAWIDWMRAANKSRTLTFDDNGKSRLEDFQRRWLLSAVKS
jgi:hypothetical protein